MPSFQPAPQRVAPADNSPDPEHDTPQAHWSPPVAAHDQRRCCEAYRHPRVRDIAWLLDSADLMLTPDYPRPCLQALGLDEPIRRHQWLAALERQPAALESAVDENRHSRLGRYHELLWQFIVAQAPCSRLLVSNLRIEKGKITLGELDLLYQAGQQGPPVHLEVAIKFYLGLPEGPGAADSPARWIGPGGADSLAIKYQRSLDHQLPLTRTPRGQATVLSTLHDIAESQPLAESLLREPLKQQLAMPGALFRPWQPGAHVSEGGADTTRQAAYPTLPPPRGCHPDAARQAGWWVHVGDFALFCRWMEQELTAAESETCDTFPSAAGDMPVITSTRLQGVVREKPAWLAPPPHDTLRPWQDLQAWLHQHFHGEPSSSSWSPERHPRQLWLEDARHPEHHWRIFVVADDWPRWVPLSPPA